LVLLLLYQLLKTNVHKPHNHTMILHTVACNVPQGNSSDQQVQNQP